MIKILYIPGTKICLDFILPAALKPLKMNVLTVIKRDKFTCCHNSCIKQCKQVIFVIYDHISKNDKNKL